MPRMLPIVAAAAALLFNVGASKAETAKKSPAKAATAAALAGQAPAALSPAQLDAANRVFTGEASCEFGEKVHLQPLDGQPGYFKLSYKKASYTLAPEETTTGAVRLEDRKAGIMWLQIPAKSMLMNSKIGQRMADQCLHAEQLSAQAPAAGGAIGIASAKP